MNWLPVRQQEDEDSKHSQHSKEKGRSIKKRPEGKVRRQMKAEKKAKETNDPKKSKRMDEIQQLQPIVRGKMVLSETRDV